MRIVKLSLLFVLVAGAACAAPPEIVKKSDQQSVSIIQLIANPSGFDGKNVDVGGYFEMSDEYEHTLFLDENSMRNGMSANSIAIPFAAFPPALKKRAEELNHRYVIVAGRFKAGPTAFSWGGLEEVYYIAPAPVRGSP